MGWKFTVINQWSELWDDKNLANWMQMMEESPNTHVFFHPFLVRAWLETYLPIRNLVLIFLWGHDETDNQVLFPLVLWKRNWKNLYTRMIVPVGYSDYDYHEPLFKQFPENIESFWKDCFAFLKQNYKYDLIAIEGIRDYCTSSSLNWIQNEPCPYLSLENIHSNEDLMKFFKTSLRGDIRRQIRRLSELGDLTYEEYNSITEVQMTFEDFLNHHKLKWPNAYKAPHFHENLIKMALEKGIVHFSSLNINGKPISWHLGFSYRHTYYYYMPAGDSGFAKYSPVKVHLYYLLDKMVSLGYNKYDHLRGEENYKAGWSNGCDYVNSIKICNSSLLSKMKLFINRKIRVILS